MSNVPDTLDIEGVITTKHVLHVDQHWFEARSVDPKCDICCPTAQMPVKNGTRPISLLDMARNGQPAMIYFSRQIWRCTECRKKITEILAFACLQHRMTERQAKYIYEEAIVRAFSEIADKAGIDEKTVASVFRSRAVAEISARGVETPRVLGLDEKYLFGSMRAVVGNIEKKTMYWMLEGRDSASLLNFFESIKDPHKVEVVTVDMHRPYHKVIKKCFPKATIVIDKFHILKSASDCLESYRLGLSKEVLKQERAELLEGRKTLIARKRNWSEIDHARYNKWLVYYPGLAEAYDLKEELYAIFEQNITKHTAIRKYINWRESLTYTQKAVFRPFVKSVQSLSGPILNYFDNRYTNGYVEALNKMIGLSALTVSGGSFETLFYKVMLRYGVPKPPTKKINRRRPIEDDLVMGFLSFDYINDCDYVKTEKMSYKTVTAPISYGVPLVVLEKLINEPDFGV